VEATQRRRAGDWNRIRPAARRRGATRPGGVGRAARAARPGDRTARIGVGFGGGGV